MATNSETVKKGRCKKKALDKKNLGQRPQQKLEEGCTLYLLKRVGKENSGPQYAKQRGWQFLTDPVEPGLIYKHLRHSFIDSSIK